MSDTQVTPTTQVRVTIYFRGCRAGALGVGSDFTERRTLQLPSPFTEEQVKEVAHVNLYEKQGDSPAFEIVRVTRVAFN